MTSFSMFSHEWRKPFNISIGLHVLILALAMLAPALFDRQPILPEIYTVNLFSAAEVAEPQPAPVQAAAPETVAEPVVREIEPEQQKPAISIKPAEPEPARVAETAIAKPVSLQPLKMKVKIGKTPEEEARERARLDVVKRQLQAGAERKETKEAADRAKRDAVDKLADFIKANTAANTAANAVAARAAGQTTSTAKSTTGVSGPRGTGVEPDFYMKQYLSTVYQRIHDHWVLPDLQNWDNSLEAILIIAITRSGTVTESYFEKKSSNIYFNQFVLKAVKDAAPLPPFPDQLQENTLEIGLRFKPGELY